MRHLLYFLLSGFLLTACSTPYTYTYKLPDASVGVSKDIEGDSAITAMIAPYKAQLDKQMKVSRLCFSDALNTH